VTTVVGGGDTFSLSLLLPLFCNFPCSEGLFSLPLLRPAAAGLFVDGVLARRRAFLVAVIGC